MMVKASQNQNLKPFLIPVIPAKEGAGV